MLIKTTLGNFGLRCRASIVAVGTDKVLAQVKTAQTAAATTNKYKYHGEIARTGDGTVDLAAEMGKHPDFLWIRVKAIESDVENDNGDFFPREEIVKAYKSFEGVPVFTNHENTDVEKAKGKVVKAEYDEATGDVYCTMYIDRKAYPHLARAVEEGYVTDVSMGTQVEYSTCSVCSNKAATAETYCFVPGTPILMADLTVVPIEEITVGAYVMDAFGKTTRVTQTSKHDVKEKIQILSSKAIMDELACTSNHPMMVKRRGDYKFVDAGAIEDNETLFSPRCIPEHTSMQVFENLEFERTEENTHTIAALIGLYAAEGCCSKQSEKYTTVEFSLGEKEEHLLSIINKSAKILGLNTSTYDREKYGVKALSVRLNNPSLASFLMNCCHGNSRTKKFSNSILQMPDKYLKTLLEYYIEGDGYSSEKSAIVIHSASRNLASQVFNLLGRLGIAASINSFLNSGGPTNREATTPVYRVSFGSTQAKKFGATSGKIHKAAQKEITQSKLKNILTEDGQFVKHTVSVEEVEYEGPVHNFETETHSYVASNTAVHNCDHVRLLKGRAVNGKKVFEKNYGLKFIEISVVTDGACKDCTIREVIDPSEFIASAQGISRAANAITRRLTTGSKIEIETEREQTNSGTDNAAVEAAVEASTDAVASAKNAFKTAIGEFSKTALLRKDGGQAEIGKLNQAMDLLEDVTRAMLDQRQFIDLEFMQKVAEVLAELQHVTDELVDQGYGSVGQQPAAPGIPQLPDMGQTGQEQAPENPMGAPDAAPTELGVGQVTEPVSASAGPAFLHRTASQLKDLLESVKKSLGERRTSKKSGGMETVSNNKHEETIRKLSGIWDTPSVKNYKTEVADCDGKLRIAIGSDEIVGSYNGEKVATLKVASLGSDIRLALEENPAVMGREILKALEVKMNKQAEKSPVDGKEQVEQTFEAQLRDQKLPKHPRQNDVRESITEKQLSEKTEGYDYNARTDEPKHAITEKQLSEKSKGYDQFERQGEERRDTTEKQLRDEGIKGNNNPADGPEKAAGVSDQHEQVTEGQLNDWKNSDKGHSPKDRITEKQLREDQGEPLARRLASVQTKEEARFAIAAAEKALARTAKATGATPSELIDAIADFDSNPENSVRAMKTASKFDTSEARNERETILKRASFHGSNTGANMSSVCTFLLGSLADVELAPSLGLKTLASISSSKNAMVRIAEAIKGLKVEDAPKAQVGTDLIREALLDSSEKIVIVIAKKDIKAETSNKEAFAAAAFEIATKEANARNIKITERVKVAENNGEVEVTLMGVAEEAKTEPKVEVVASKEVKLEARSEARKATVVEAQVGPGGGMGAAPAGAPAGGTPGDMGGMGGAGPATPPVANLGGDLTDPIPGDDMEEEGKGEASPPGTICPVCGSDDVDVRGGDLQCNSCGAEGEIQVEIKIKHWPDVLTDKGPAADAGGEGKPEEEAMEMVPPGLPEVGVAASYKISPEMIKKAGKPIGSFCPRCGSTQIERTASKGGCSSKCQSCDCSYSVDISVDMETPTEIVARVEYTDKAMTKVAKVADKKAKLNNALKAKGLTAAFAKADFSGKADIIAMLHDEKAL